MTKTPVAVLISGRGSNMQALVAAAKDPAFPADIRLVMANSAEAAGLDWARAQGIEALSVPHKPFGRLRAAHEAVIDAVLRDRGIRLVCLAGYMRVLTPYLVGRWQGRMLNIHPSLLPAYPGLHTHERALAAGEAEAGCTVHLVTSGVDEGPILGQARVPILSGDTPDTLAARVLTQEHRLYPAMLAAHIRTLNAG
ncbi:MAG: phosphoribosylglycinamide formyltransferase [Asticcacaulis sp.]